MRLKIAFIVVAVGLLSAFLLLQYLERRATRPTEDSGVIHREFPPSTSETPGVHVDEVPVTEKPPPAMREPGQFGLDACQKEYKPRKIIEWVESQRGSKTWFFGGEGEFIEMWALLLDFYVCQAVEAKHTAVCNDFPKEAYVPWNVGGKEAKYCLERYYDYLTWESQLRKDFDNAAKYCEKTFEIRGRSIQDGCKSLVRLTGREQIKEICRFFPDATFKGAEKPGKSRCEVGFRGLLPWNGLSDCSGAQGNIKFICQDKAAILNAIRQNDPNKCGSSNICAAVMRSSPNVCLPMERETTRLFCENRRSQLLDNEKVIRRQYGMAAYKDGDEFISLLSPEEKRTYELAMPEKIFRRAYDLPPHKPGDPYLHLLPPEQRAQYERGNLKKLSPQRKIKQEAQQAQ